MSEHFHVNKYFMSGKKLNLTKSFIYKQLLISLFVRDSSARCVARVGASSLPTEGQEDGINNTLPRYKYSKS